MLVGNWVLVLVNVDQGRFSVVTKRTLIVRTLTLANRALSLNLSQRDLPLISGTYLKAHSCCIGWLLLAATQVKLMAE